MIKEGDFVKVNKYIVSLLDFDADEVYVVDKISGDFAYLDGAPHFPVSLKDIEPATEEDLMYDDAPKYSVLPRNFVEWIMDVFDARTEEILDEIESRDTTRYQKESKKKDIDSYMKGYEKLKAMDAAISEYGDTFSFEEIIESGLAQ
jgi:hypothetical protein